MSQTLEPKGAGASRTAATPKSEVESGLEPFSGDCFRVRNHRTEILFFDGADSKRVQRFQTLMRMFRTGFLVMG